MWGFNTYGQVGLGDKKTHWLPERIVTDVEGTSLHYVRAVACSNYSTFCIDENGNPYSWGKGFVGHSGETMNELPQRITKNTSERHFVDVFANSDSCLFYAPVRAYNIEPKCGPSKGGTNIKITGTGFADSDKLRARFVFGQQSTEVTCQFDSTDGSLVCKTPVFSPADEETHLKLPCDCQISITLDGVNYSDCEAPFKIYSNDIFLTAVNPKCGSVTGGS